ncbi:hypothetical protein VNO77_21644 [Canavalia gladiata]|uniref:Uncharacterized protein n=1 Tax=Canavalia gladiata TaxID=3824 RepID=A0AAN9QNN2_CANGL
MMEMETLLPNPNYGGSKRCFGRRIHQRLDGGGSRKKMKVVRLGGSRRYWKIKAIPRIRYVMRSPLKMLTKLKNAYINFMSMFSSNVGAMNTDNIYGAKRIPNSRQANGYSSEFESRLIVEISKLMACLSFSLVLNSKKALRPKTSPKPMMEVGKSYPTICRGRDRQRKTSKQMETVETKADADSFWTWNANNNDQRQFSMTKFLGNKPPKPQTSVLGPGFGAGFGCGAGIGFGLVGGFGYGGWPFNNLHLVFGLGMGCGLGLGLGFGQGIGYNFNFRTRKSRKSKKNFSDSNKTIVIQI